MANELISMVVSSDDMWREYIGLSAVNALFGVGRDSNYVRGSLRFTGILLNQGISVNHAELWMKVETRLGSSAVKARIKGIAEDNTATGNPFGRTRTTAYVDVEYLPSGTGWFIADVSSIVNEIIARSGWTSGNALCFVAEDNGTSSSGGNTVREDFSSENSLLVYRASALPNFKPTPVSVSAPAIPDPMDCGFKFSEPGENVLTATADKMYINTGKTQVKIEEEGVVTSSGAGVIPIAHGLGYKSVVRVQFKGAGGSDNWVRLPSANLAGGVNYYLNSTNLYLYATASGQTFYYRISLDQIAA